MMQYNLAILIVLVVLLVGLCGCQHAGHRIPTFAIVAVGLLTFSLACFESFGPISEGITGGMVDQTVPPPPPMLGNMTPPPVHLPPPPMQEPRKPTRPVPQLRREEQWKKPKRAPPKPFLKIPANVPLPPPIADLSELEDPQPIPAEEPNTNTVKVKVTQPTAAYMADSDPQAVEFGETVVTPEPPAGLAEFQERMWRKKNPTKPAPFQEFRPTFVAPFIDNRTPILNNKPWIPTLKEFQSVDHYYQCMKYTLKYNPNNKEVRFEDPTGFYEAINMVDSEKLAEFADKLAMERNLVPSQFWEKPKVGGNDDEDDDDWGEETYEERNAKLEAARIAAEQKAIADASRVRITPVAKLPRYGNAYLKDLVMLNANRMKFNQQPNLRELLKETGDANIQYTWGNYWGGQANNLGRILMIVRENL